MEDESGASIILFFLFTDAGVDFLTLDRGLVEAVRRGLAAEGMQQLRQLVNRVLALRMDHTEFTCLKVSRVSTANLHAVPILIVST